MKIIYDSDQPGHRRCQSQDESGVLHPIASYDIKIDDGRLSLKMKRWGTEKERRGRVEAIREAMAKESQDAGK